MRLRFLVFVIYNLYIIPPKVYCQPFITEKIPLENKRKKSVYSKGIFSQYLHNLMIIQRIQIIKCYFAKRKVRYMMLN